MHFLFVVSILSSTQQACFDDFPVINANQEYNNENHCYSYWLFVNLTELSPFIPAVIDEVEGIVGSDPIAGRLRDLGFVAGEPVRIVARGPFGADPLLVQIGFTRFALRRSEAQRVHIHLAN